MVAQKTKTPRSVKAHAASGFVPQNRSQVIDAITRIGTAQRERRRIEAAMNDEIAAAKTRYEAEAAPHNDLIQELRAGVQTWCEAHRDELTNGGKVKTASFASGEVKWRMTPPSVVIRGVEATMDLLRKLGLARFIHTKDEVNKDAILAEPDAVASVPTISIKQHEEFVIEPFETPLEEV